MAYDLHLYYDGYPSDTLERCQEKMKFEQERLYNIRNQNYVDTFEKFLDFAEDEVEIVENNQNQKKIAALEAKNQHCTVCKTLLGQN